MRCGVFMEFYVSQRHNLLRVLFFSVVNLSTFVQTTKNKL